MSAGALRLGTRRSALATTQSGWVADRLSGLGRPAELVEVVTRGDVDRTSLAALGGTGVFVTALREALLAKEVDLAVHSLKDLPTAPADGLVVAAVPAREDPRDVVVASGGRTLGELPPGSTVGTGSPRRAAQLRALGLGLEVVDVRGNVDTRIRLATQGPLDAVVLARAGLARLGRLDEATEVLDPLQMLPAPGQGALAVECRADDDDLVALLARLDDLPTRLAVTAERAVLATLEAGCAAPLGALAELVEGDEGPELFVRAVVASVDGAHDLRRSLTRAVPAGLLDAGPSGRDEAVDLARRAGDELAALLLEDGAADLMTSLSISGAGTAAPGDVADTTPTVLHDSDPAGEGDS